MGVKLGEHDKPSTTPTLNTPMLREFLIKEQYWHTGPVAHLVEKLRFHP